MEQIAWKLWAGRALLAVLWLLSPVILVAFAVFSAVQVLWDHREFIKLHAQMITFGLWHYGFNPGPQGVEMNNFQKPKGNDGA